MTLKTQPKTPRKTPLRPLAQHKTTDLRVESLRPLIPPAILAEELPLSEAAARVVGRGREEVAQVLHGLSDRLVVVVGPCSIHDPDAAREYAEKLLKVARAREEDLLIVMRVYFEKPRTTVGWKGLINDPKLDGSFAINEGLRTARGLLRDIVETGLPAGCEFLDPISPQFIADLVSWGAIGARTTESQVHRELASGLSMPIGFKNGTDGNTRIAVEGVISARHPHRFLGVTEQGLAAIVATRGNPDCHVILRGGSTKPNYDAESVAAAVGGLAQAQLAPRLMVDVSHANSLKDHHRQPLVSAELAERIAAGDEASSSIFGLMMESFLIEGRQDFSPGAKLKYGQSVTDACMSWKTTASTLELLARAVAARRKKTAARASGGRSKKR